MITFVHTRQRTGRIALTIVFAVILSEAVTKTDVLACRSWQQCLTISECRRAQRDNKLPPGAVMDFSSSFLYPCDESPPKICCTIKSPNDPDTEDPGYNITYGDGSQASEIIPVALPLNVGGSQKEAYLPTESCGLFKKGNHEENAAPGQFPWLALIGRKDKERGDLQFQCGGSLINNRYILTSAYCLENMKLPPEIVRLGEYDQSTKEGCQSESQGGCVQDYKVEKVIIHELYNNPLLKNDIALLRLKGFVPTFTENIKPICLPTGTLSSEFYTIAGWGIDENRNLTKTSIPKFGTLTLLGPKECTSLPIPVQPVAETQLCSGKTKPTCFGDPGGPLMGYKVKENAEYGVQVGIISYAGFGCQNPFSSDLYTNVASFMDWIAKNISE